MGKKHQKNSTRPSELSSEQLERQAHDDMGAGRFRKARDIYKILCKQDREKNLPGLIEANRRLAEQLTGNGLISEAEQVLAYLNTIAPASIMLANEVCVAVAASPRCASVVYSSAPMSKSHGPRFPLLLFSF